MPIQSVPRAQFEAFHPGRRTSSWPYEEVEWFVERSRILIGSIVRNAQSDDWRFVVEGRDERGQFHEVESGDQLHSQEDARALLEKTIQELLATGLKVFRRGAPVLSPR